MGIGYKARIKLIGIYLKKEEKPKTEEETEGGSGEEGSGEEGGGEEEVTEEEGS